MDLDALKKSWEALPEDPFVSRPEQRIADLLHLSSRSSVAKMKRNLRWDLVLSLLCLGYLSAYYLLQYNGSLWPVSLFFFTWTLLSGLYFFRKGRLLNKMMNPDWNVKQNSEKQLSTLQQYIHWYLLAVTLFFPLAVLLLYALVWRNKPALLANRDIIFHWLSSGGVNMIIALMAIAATTVLLYFSSKWYLHKLYGNHIRKLTDLVKEINE
jgi:hypothetical protein